MEYDYFTESRGQMVNTPASFREVPGSDLGPKTDYRDWGFSCFSPVPLGECRGNILKLDNDRFLPNPF
jgi:hypothetical protein